ncbi:MAG: C1 family peptidase [Myxococcales bacterium]|nr:C1 family peptidase [Myxococcales bacterium]
MRARYIVALTALFALGSIACSGDSPGSHLLPRNPAGGKADNTAQGSNDPPLSKLSTVLPEGSCQADGACQFPANPAPPPTDDTPPSKFYFLLNQDGAPPLQSAVKSQGSRGVCSIFANIALAEHLYLKARVEDPTIEARVPEDIDFSEQYLQWSVKFEVNSFPDSSGSNAYYNLTSLARYGVVLESVWPYETSQWNTGNDEECDGSGTQPTRCYTNGHPTDDQKAQAKYKLPTSRSLSARSIKKHIYENELGVVVGLKFFYQSWNHRKSTLKVNSTYWNKGYVLYPNTDDEDDSSGDRSAGHGILIIGWDDELEVATVDKDGKATCDDDAATKVDPNTGSCPEGSKMLSEKGFYLFKNSWGTAGFGRQSGIGAGYGYISQRYVHEYASARVAGIPTVDLVPKPDDGNTEPTEKSQTFSGSVSQGNLAMHEIQLGEGATDIVVKMTGSNDADLYTRFDEQPDPDAGDGRGYDCRPWVNGSNEECKHPSARGRTLYIAAHGYASGSSTYSIEVSWKE